MTLPKYIIAYLKRNTANMSQYISEAVGERIARENRERVFKEIVEGPPSFTDVDDSVEYVRKLRAADEKRSKRLGL